MIDFKNNPHLLEQARRNIDSYNFDPDDCKTDEELEKRFAEFYRLPWYEEDWIEGYEDEYNLLYSYWKYAKELLQDAAK